MTILLLLAVLTAAPGSWKEHMDAGNLRLKSGDYRGAEKEYARALRLISDDTTVSGELAATCNNLGSVYQELGRESEAEKLYLRSIAMWRKLNHSEAVARPLNNLGILYRRQRRYTEAERLLSESLKLRVKALPPGDPYIGRVQHNLARVYQALGDFSRAEELHAQAVNILEDKPDLASELAGVLAHLGNVQRLRGSARARKTLERSVEVATNSLPSDHPLWIDILMCSAALATDQSDWTSAHSMLSRAVSIAEAKLGGNHPVTGNAMAQYAVALRKLGRGKEANDYERRSEQVLRSYRGSYTVDVGELIGNSR